MTHTGLLTFIAIIAIVSAFAFRWSFLHYKKFAHISLMQYFFLIIIPGVSFSIIFSFILDILDRPLNTQVFLNSRLITILLLLSILFTYAGLVIHTITKTLSGLFDKNNKSSFVYKVNKYFHLTFSHNLVFTGMISTAMFISMLEINHIPSSGQNSSFFLSILNGVVLGMVFVAGLIIYRIDRKDWSEHMEKIPWSDLKFFFYAFWMVFLIFIYASRPHFGSINNYPITLSMLTAGLVIALLSVFLYSRRIRRLWLHRRSEKN